MVVGDVEDLDVSDQRSGRIVGVGAVELEALVHGAAGAHADAERVGNGEVAALAVAALFGDGGGFRDVVCVDGGVRGGEC